MSNFNEPHICPDWGGMLVVPRSKEMEVCECGNRGARVKYGDTVKTDFKKREEDKIRIVESCTRTNSHSQSGWTIKTRCGLAADSAWFREV